MSTRNTIPDPLEYMWIKCETTVTWSHETAIHWEIGIAALMTFCIFVHYSVLVLPRDNNICARRKQCCHSYCFFTLHTHKEGGKNLIVEVWHVKTGKLLKTSAVIMLLTMRWNRCWTSTITMSSDCFFSLMLTHTSCCCFFHFSSKDDTIWLIAKSANLCECWYCTKNISRFNIASLSKVRG